MHLHPSNCLNELSSWTQQRRSDHACGFTCRKESGALLTTHSYWDPGPVGTCREGSNSYWSDIYSESDRRSRYKAISLTFSKNHNNRFMLFYFMPKSQEIFWPFQRLCFMEFPLKKCTSFLLQISDFTYGWSKQIFWGIRSVCPHKKLLPTFYCFLNEFKPLCKSTMQCKWETEGQIRNLSSWRS